MFVLLISGNMTSDEVIETEGVPRSIWLLLVINLGVMVAAIIIGGACCRKGAGVTRQYNTLPPSTLKCGTVVNMYICT